MVATVPARAAVDQRDPKGAAGRALCEAVNGLVVPLTDLLPDEYVLADFLQGVVECPFCKSLPAVLAFPFADHVALMLG